jgi:hypothetical protein
MSNSFSREGRQPERCGFSIAADATVPRFPQRQPAYG